MRRLVLVFVTLVSLVAGSAPPSGATPADEPDQRQWGLARIEAPQAWATGTTGAGVVVAVVDTGVEKDHPEFTGRWHSKSATCGDDGMTTTLVVCTTGGGNDAHGHGTHVAGIIAAARDGAGSAGVAPDATVLSVRVYNDHGRATVASVAAGIQWAADNGARVINISLGPNSVVGEVAGVVGVYEPIHDALEYAWGKGAVPVVAAGNDSLPLCSVMARFPEGLCVGATDRDDDRTFYSNSDATTLYNYVVAPGGSGACEDRVFSTYLHGKESSCPSPDGYAWFSGTSMAAPHVAGVAALLAGLGLNNAQIVQRILATADRFGLPAPNSIYGYGRVNARRAVNNVTSP